MEFLLMHQPEQISQFSLAHLLVALLGHDQLVEQWRRLADIIPLRRKLIVPSVLLSDQI